jgi:hypothetical protein
MVVYVKLTGLRATHAINKVKYCNFLGHKLFKSVKFITNNVVLDEYTTEDYNFHYQFNVPVHKKNGWKKCAGQEIPIMANLTADPVYQEFRQQIPILSGPQTLKRELTSVEIFMPLLFWFKDPKLAVPNSTLPFGQTFLQFDLSPLADLCGCADFAGDGGLFTPPKITDFHLYTNHIYMNSEILDIFNKRIGLTLIRVHKYQEIILNQHFGDVLLNELKYPIETLYATFRPTINMDGDDKLDTWNLNSKLDKTLIQTPVMYDTTGNGDYTFGYNDMIYYKESPVVNRLEVKADGITIFDDISALFYNSYIPYQYGLQTSIPEDASTYMFSFNFSMNSSTILV